MFFFRKWLYVRKKTNYWGWKHFVLSGLILFLLICVVFLYEALLTHLAPDNLCDEMLLQQERILFEKHKQRALLNHFNFNDINYSEVKEKNCFRIIALGDSIIFGHGLPLEQIWSHKFERALKKKYSVEVLHWGRCGWSTLDQLEFLKRNFSDKKNIFDADLILVSWFDNDPDMGDINFDRYESLLSNSYFKMFNRIFPKLSSLFFDMNGFCVYLSILRQLYSVENLCRYKNVLQELKSFCQGKKIDLFFAMVSYGDFLSKYGFGKIEGLFQNESLSYINLHPIVAKQVEGIPFKKLYANPVNSHPGDILTTLYARYICAEIVKKYGSKMKQMKNFENPDLSL